jgi:5-aminolevulinate synthase
MYNKYFESYIDNIKKEGRYREFMPLLRLAKESPYAIDQDGRKIVLWCINDYLSMSANSEVVKTAKDVLDLCGVGSGGTRNIGGNNKFILELEETIADLHNTEKALVFTSGYVANVGFLSSLAKIIPNLVYISDEMNHASIIDGIKKSSLEKYIYHHNDMESLESILRSLDLDIPKMVVFESIYSMSGNIAHINQIVDLAAKYNAITYIDEVHSVGLYGNRGSGIANQFGLENKIDIIQGTLGKAYGVIGGYIAASEKIINAIKSVASTFIFTTSLPPSIAAAANCSIRHLMGCDVERYRFKQNVCALKNSLFRQGIEYYDNDSHIIPIIIGDPIIAKKISEDLFVKHGIYLQHINYPTIPRGTERLRITVTPNHTQDMINHLVESLANTLAFYGIKTNSNIEA